MTSDAVPRFASEPETGRDNATLTYTPIPLDATDEQLQTWIDGLRASDHARQATRNTA